MATLEMATLGVGNTNSTPSKQKAYVLTINEKSLEHYQDIKGYLTGLKTNTYYLCCEHVGQENKHYHVYVQFSNAIKLSIKKLHGAHVEKAFGSAQQNIAYLRCEDDKHKKLNIQSIQIDEIGMPKFHGGCRVVKDIKEMDSLDEIPIMYYNIARQIKNQQHEEAELLNVLNEIKDDNLSGPEVVYISGPSGAGKTYSAYKMALEKFKPEQIGKININNNFFKFTGLHKECYVIEEFRPSQLHAAEFLQLTDKYGYNANTKGGFEFIRPKMIIICSIIPPEELYKDEEINKQFLRRITQNLEVNDKHMILIHFSTEDIHL